MPKRTATGGRRDNRKSRAVSEPAIIRQLIVTRFRGIKALTWNPSPGLNIILGGGDVGKTTVLEGIGLLLTASNAVALSESDYWQRETAQEFCIEAVMSLPPSSEISQQHSFAWPWEWNGKDAVLPAAAPDGAGDEAPEPANPVYRLRVRGTTNLEPVWEIVQPNDEASTLSTGVRRKIGAVRLGGDDRNDRDLRLVYGSALDRLLADSGLRSRISQQISEIDLNARLSDDGKKSMETLDAELRKAALPSGIKLGLTTSQGLSIGALIGLLATKEGVPLPLASWGAGTRRMAALEIASATEKESSVALIDEIERGLEPYRLRKLISTLEKGIGQSFVTTHSAVAITCAESGHLWYLDAAGNMGALPFDNIRHQQRRDPETFLARLPVIAEGSTEVGFFRFLLEKTFKSNPLDYGVRICDGQGNAAVLGLLETMAATGLKFAAFVDNEGDETARWQILKTKLGSLLFQWDSGCLEQNIIGEFPEGQLESLLSGDDGTLDGERLRTLADRAGSADKSLDAIRKKTADLRALIIAAATGSKTGAPVGGEKEWKAHERCWFKSEAGGRELAGKMAAAGVWPKFQPKLLPLLNAILRNAGLPELQQLDL
jgi:putative ATP-dependent endonuclease of OLD family